MANVTPPRLAQLVSSMFPKEAWAKSLVEQFNQFAIQVTQAIRDVSSKYKTLDFSTSATVADSFPIVLKAEPIPADVRVAQVVSGTPNGAVTVQWRPNGDGISISVESITGLAVNTTYSIRLAMD